MVANVHQPLRVSVVVSEIHVCLKTGKCKNIILSSGPSCVYVLIYGLFFKKTTGVCLFNILIHLVT
jgi:hypothetical protein